MGTGSTGIPDDPSRNAPTDVDGTTDPDAPTDLDGGPAMSAGSLVVRPRLDNRHGHELVAADGHVLAGLEVAAGRDAGAIVVGTRQWSVRRPPASRVWTVTAGPRTGAGPAEPAGGDAPERSFDGEVVATITKPSAIRERFELTVGDDRLAIEPHGPVGRRRWVVSHRGEPTIEVVQGVVRRRWHELRPLDDADPAPVDGTPGRSTLILAFVVGLVDTTPPSGLGGLRRLSG